MSSEAKACSRCGVWKPLSAYYAHGARCKQCVSELYFADPVKRSARIAAQRARREKNPFHADAYRVAHRDQIRAYHRDREARLRGAESERVLIAVLIERDKGICGICGGLVRTTPGGDRGLAPSHDHIVPVSRGGPNTYANSRLAHLRCNVRRGNRD